MLRGKMKGYRIGNVTKKKIEKENFLRELKEMEPDIKQTILEVIEHKGYAYGLEEQGILKAVYLFENRKSENKSILSFKTSFSVEDVKDSMEQFEKAILEELKEIVDWGKRSKVIWGDMEIEPKEVKGFPGITFSTCLLLGIAYGILFDNLGFGIALGIAIGMSFEATVKIKKNKK